MTYTVVLSNPACGDPWTQPIEASSYQQAVELAKARWGKYVLYVKHD